MNNEEVRQLVRIRHELRRLVPERDQEQATRLLARMHALTARYENESLAIRPELSRWQSAFSLEALCLG